MKTKKLKGKQLTLKLKFGVCDKTIHEDYEEISAEFDCILPDEIVERICFYLKSDLHYYFIEQIKKIEL